MATHKQRFLAQANSWIGAKESGGNNHYEKGSKLAEIFSTYGASQGTAWCAVFVYACAKKAGIAGKIIGKNSYASGLCHTVIKKGGTWIPGPYKTGTKVKPQPGDLILYNDSSCHMKYNADGTVKAWHGYHVGLVYKVTSTQVITIEGNLKGGKCDTVKHALNAKSIGGYARPKWSKVDSGAADDDGDLGPLYTSKNDRNDMTMREIGYMNTSGKLTTSDTGVRIAILNYTTVLGDLWDMFGRNTYGGNIIDTSKLKGNTKITVDYLLKQGFNAAAACGIAGNIQTDSNYNPSTVKDGGYGICKWTGTTAGQMRMFIGEFEWATSLSGQLDFLVSDLENNYPDLLKKICAVAVTTAGAKSAAKQFAATYRKITSNTARQTVAQSLFSQIVVTPPKQVGTTPTTTTKPCTVATIKQKKQKALSSCYRTIGVGACDTTIYNEWVSKGKGQNKGLCTIGDYYLVSYNTKDLSLKVDDSIILDLNGGGTVKCLVGGGHSSPDTPIMFYRHPTAGLNMKNWANVTIKQIRNFGKR